MKLHEHPPFFTIKNSVSIAENCEGNKAAHRRTACSYG
jgi:hypothetical protein